MITFITVNILKQDLLYEVCSIQMRPLEDKAFRLRNGQKVRFVSVTTQQTRYVRPTVGYTWATEVQSGHGLKMDILSGAHLGDPARTHIGEPRWAPHVGSLMRNVCMGSKWATQGTHFVLSKIQVQTQLIPYRVITWIYSA